MAMTEIGCAAYEQRVNGKPGRDCAPPARRRGLLALAFALPLLLLASLAQAMPSAPNAPGIVDETIVESSAYLHLSSLFLYYSDNMGLEGAPFLLTGKTQETQIGDVVDCGPAFGWDPQPAPVDPENEGSWVCSPYTVTVEHEGIGSITATLILDGGGSVDDILFLTVEDNIDPASKASPLQYSNEQEIPVSWSASDPKSDGYASGVQRTYLLYTYDSQPWITATSSAGTSGTFDFSPPVENVTYNFQTRAVDNVGNLEPLGSGDGYTIYDTLPPDSSAQSPYVTNSETIPLTLTVDPDLSGLDYLRLWYRFEEGEWVSTAYTSTQDYWEFDFPAAGDDGTYCFQTIAVDNATNVESGPSGDGDTETLLDTQPPSATVETPAQVASFSWDVSWLFHDDDPSSGPNLYEVQYRQEGGNWLPWLTTAQTTAVFGPTDPIAVQNHLTYAFRAKATDLAGNQSVDWGPEVSTAVDIYYVYGPLMFKSFPWNRYYEDNDEWADAYGPLQVGTQYRAYPDDEYDFYYFDLPTSAKVSIYVTNYAPVSTHGDLYLYDEEQEFIAQHGAQNETAMEILNQSLKAGKYYVIVRTEPGYYNTTTLYNLTVSW